VDDWYVDESGHILWNKLKPAHYCGHEYKTKFVAVYQTMEVNLIYKEPIGERQRQP
jgi:hypothetical protein